MSDAPDSNCRDLATPKEHVPELRLPYTTAYEVSSSLASLCSYLSPTVPEVFDVTLANSSRDPFGVAESVPADLNRFVLRVPGLQSAVPLRLVPCDITTNLFAGPPGQFVIVVRLAPPSLAGKILLRGASVPLGLHATLISLEERLWEYRDAPEKAKFEEECQHALTRLHAHLPRAAVLSGPSLDTSAILPERLEATLASQGLPLAQGGGYSARMLNPRQFGCLEKNLTGEQVALVEYNWQQTSATFFDLLEVAHIQVPTAFRTPLRAGAKAPRIAFSSGLTVSLEHGPGQFRWPDSVFEKRRKAEKVRKAIAAKGTEAIGWYQSFHEWDEKSWGIYLKDEALLDLAADLANRLPPASQVGAMRFALWAVCLFVMEHERFHSRVDRVALMLESATRRSLYRRYFRGAYARSKAKGPVEEALAEHAGHTQLRLGLEAMVSVGQTSKDEARTILDFFIELSASAPPGYRDWQVGNDPVSKRRLLVELGAGRPHGISESCPPLEYLFESGILILDSSDVPLHVPVGGAIEDALLRPIKRRILAREFGDGGFVERTDRGKGSHTLFEHPDGRTFTLPGHDEISPGVSRRALRVLAMTADEWRRERAGAN